MRLGEFQEFMAKKSQAETLSERVQYANKVVARNMHDGVIIAAANTHEEVVELLRQQGANEFEVYYDNILPPGEATVCELVA